MRTAAKKKLLIVNKAFWPSIGGVEETARELAEAASTDFDVTILAVAEGEERRQYRCGHSSVVKVPLHARPLSTPLSLEFMSAYRTLAKCADVIHIHSPYPPAELAFVTTPSRARAVITYHFDVVRQRALAPLYAPLIRRALIRCDRIVVSNPNLARTSPMLKNLSWKVSVAPPGIDFGDFQLSGDELPLVRNIRSPYRRPIVLFVGRLVYYKGVDFLIKAIRGVEAELVVIGRGPLEPQLRQLASREGVADRVHFLGGLSRTELKLQFHACDLFVLPSVARSEAFGLVLLEAMAAGKPLITTELGTGTSWVNDHSRTGLVVPPGNVDALGQAIKSLLEDPTRRSCMSQAARKRVREVFSYQGFCRGYLEAYTGR